MIRGLGNTGALARRIRYFLRLPFVALEVISTEGWSEFQIKLEHWLHKLASGQVKYQVGVPARPKTVTHNNTIFGEKVDYVRKIMGMLENDYQSIDPDEKGSLEVVVAIHNAYDDVLRCLYSLLNYQDIYRILLLDDCSTDTRVKDFLRTLKKHEHEAFRVETNPQNLGYVKTANKGMRMAKNDVILLNSDTVVTPGWARKMRACAYSNDRIATVTPFTNHGWICSIPEFLENNEIPEGFTVDTFADCVENASSNRCPELITAVGFCMYIRRSVIDEIGYLDEVNFGKGYGEEVDFSYRAACKGYKNILCDNTFVFHRGQASFFDTHKAVFRKRARALRKKHPGLWTRLRQFERSNPLKWFHDKLRTEMEARRSRNLAREKTQITS